MEKEGEEPPGQENSPQGDEDPVDRPLDPPRVGDQLLEPPGEGDRTSWPLEEREADWPPHPLEEAEVVFTFSHCTPHSTTGLLKLNQSFPVDLHECPVN